MSDAPSAASRRFNDRPLPSLAEWLGDGTRAVGFEEWVREMFAVEQEMASAVDQRSMRIFRTLGIAFTEILRRERDIEGSAVPALVTLARCCGVSVIVAAITVVDPEKLAGGILKIAALMQQEFAYGADRCAQTTHDSAIAGAPPP